MVIRDLFRLWGFDIKRYPLRESIDYGRNRLLASYGIDLVLDVGANIGQYAQSLRSVGYQGQIVSFEPMTKEFDALLRKTCSDERWECVNTALGETEKNGLINIAGNSISSSLLPMLGTHLYNSPNSKYIGKEDIQVTTLDKLAPNYIKNGDRILLKMDVQGYELQVLKGGQETIPTITLIESELSLIPLYDRQVLYREMIDYLASKGFDLAYIQNGFMDTIGHVLQVDAIFVNTKKSKKLSPKCVS